MSTPSRDPVRMRQGLNPLTTTSLGPFLAQQHNTPMSAVSMTTTHAHTPASAIQPYNPQEWIASPTPTPDRMPQHYNSESQGSPRAPPPPPYSPPRSQQPRPISGSYDSSPASATPRILTPTVLRPSPDAQPTTSFPPPPGTGGRGGSRERRFGLPSLSRRRDQDQGAVTPDHGHSSPLARQAAPSPITIIPIESARFQPSPVTPFQAAAPAARRAVSTGAITTPVSARSRSGSQAGWGPGMPLPPPPPGPPPAGSRSQSVTAAERATTSTPMTAPPTRRPPPEGISSLGPVPRTPANWLDSDTPPPQQASEEPRGLVLDTVNVEAGGPTDSGSSSAGGLNRARAVRHDKTIIQRRTESRSRQDPQSSIDERTQPQSLSNIVVPDDAQGSSSRHRSDSSKRMPQSGGHDMPRTGESSLQPSSRNATPRAIGSAKLTPLDTGTPPFSPHPLSAQKRPGSAQNMVPKALPTPPPQTRSTSVASRNGESSRQPLSAALPPAKHEIVTQSADQFAAGTIERFRAFASKESMASTDAERVRLFADFIVSESRVRRERYSAAIGAMGSETFDLTRDLFRPMAVERRDSSASRQDWNPATADRSHSRQSSVGSAAVAESAPSSSKAPMPPPVVTTNNGTWNNNYMPSLSPILSMSVSENYENGSSRGRPSSRWWETDSQGTGGRGLERSKRESKYMGVPKEQWVEEDPDFAPNTAASEHSSSTTYPPEKVGWHESQLSTTPQASRLSMEFSRNVSTPTMCGQGLLDVSRLVTMPPPYPRHHPAVNNNHPELAGVRASVRALSNLGEVEELRKNFSAAGSKRREENSKATIERRQALRLNLQKELQSGNLEYADAAAIESHSADEERSRAKEFEKSEYERFQNEVIVPMNDLLTGRITRATQLFEDLARQLFDNEQNDADMPQEEGDDRPELLEKLTLLKWIFEARENLHRAIYDLLSDRNGRYRDVILTPYKLSGNTEKLKSAEAFFADDAVKRDYDFSVEVMNRTRDFRTVTEQAVDRGVALQLSAFWDIAPPLTRILDSIPLDLSGFNVQIPLSEFDENPSYHDHPLQYLFSLLLHAEKSTYQFIEAHTNLLCLLHEVKEAVVHSKAKVLGSQMVEADGKPIPEEERSRRSKHMREIEERRLTEDLKEKVRLVQEQWYSALGEGFKNVKERTGEWLLETGGWDETLEDGGVGVV